MIDSLTRSQASGWRARSRSYRNVLTRESGGRVSDAASAVLAQAAAAREAVHTAQVAELEAAVAWAQLHPGPPAEDGAGRERALVPGGEGSPGVAEFAVAELALALGVSTDSGRALLADALELAHRLPQCWAALLAGGIAPFRARRVAQSTRDLPPAAAAHVDDEVAPHLQSIGVRALEGVVEAAIWRHDLARVLDDVQTSMERRGVDVWLDAPAPDGAASGTVAVSAVLDRADAVELETAVGDLAHQLLRAGSSEPLDVRRAQALGMLARGERPLVLPEVELPAHREEWDDLDDPEAGDSPREVVRRRRVVLYCHLTEEALRSGHGLARLEGHARPVTVEQVRSWCHAPGTSTTVVVRPVIDLANTRTVGSYEVPDSMTEAVVLRDRTCVFPHCSRDARCADCDHVVPHCRCGPTSTANLAPLCRRHHRLKTHGEAAGWHYRVLHPGTYLWTTPHQQQLLRDPGGTHTLSRAPGG